MNIIMLEKTNQMIMLFDFYGELLTPRQKEIFKLYYYEDLSLGEIADIEKISRQAVYDFLQRGEEILSDYEQKLGLVSMFESRKRSLIELRKILKNPLDEVSRKKCLNLLDDLLRSES